MAEICAFTDGAWIRIACELVEDDRFEAKKSMLDACPNLRGMYDENDGNIAPCVRDFKKDSKHSEPLGYIGGKRDIRDCGISKLLP